jgi:hypothetical protein
LQSKERKENEMLKFAQIIAREHYFYIIEQIISRESALYASCRSGRELLNHRRILPYLGHCVPMSNARVSSSNVLAVEYPQYSAFLTRGR